MKMRILNIIIKEFTLYNYNKIPLFSRALLPSIVPKRKEDKKSMVYSRPKIGCQHITYAMTLFLISASKSYSRPNRKVLLPR